MRKILLVLVMLSLFAACGKKAEAPKTDEKPVIKIGVNLPMTGNMAYAGENLSQALKMGLDDIAKERSLKYDYELKVEDNVFDVKKTLVNLQRMKSLDNINAVLSLWGTDGIITADFAAKNDILHFSCSLSDKVGDGKYTFNHATTPLTHMNKLIEHLKKNKYENLGILYDNALEIEEFVQKLTPILEKEKINTLFKYSINVGETDLRQLIVKMKEYNPDALFVWNAPPALMTFAKQKKEAQWDVPLISINLFSFAPELYEGEIFLTEDSGDADFAKKYHQYSGLNVMPCTVNFYDSIKMIVSAYEETKPSSQNTIPSLKEIVDTILSGKMNYKSLLDIKMDKYGNIDSKSVIKRIVGGIPIIEEE